MTPNAKFAMNTACFIGGCIFLAFAWNSTLVVPCVIATLANAFFYGMNLITYLNATKQPAPLSGDSRQNGEKP